MLLIINLNINLTEPDADHTVKLVESIDYCCSINPEWN